MKRIVHVIDSINDTVGMGIRWLITIMILATTYEVFMRYFFNSPTSWAHTLVEIVGGIVICVGWGYVHKVRGHVRIDIIYEHLSPRTQAILDVVCAILFFFPLVILLIYMSSQWVEMSIVQGEKWDVSFWEPPKWPSRLALVVGVALLGLQGIAQLLRDIHFLRRGEQL